MINERMSMCLLLLAAGLSSALAARPFDEELMLSFYDFEVAGYCSMVTEPMAAGFDQEVKRIMEAKNINDQGMQNARMEAWKEANLEWQNRGLGGFKGWCRTEGQAAVERFTK